MDRIEALGLLAGAMTTLSFVPQVARTWRRRSAADFSLPMLLLFVGGVALWLAYGAAVGSLPIMLPNLVTLVLASFILAMKLRRG